MPIVVCKDMLYLHLDAISGLKPISSIGAMHILDGGPALY